MRHRPGRLVLLGHPVAHSLSPAFQNAALDAAGITLRYEAIDVAPAALDAMLHQLRAEDAAGNVTIPHKEAVHARCGRLTPDASLVGAVNTFWHDGGTLVGDNTDIGGIDAAARRLLGGDPRDLVVGVFGAGGAGAAAVAAVSRWPGCRALVANRTGGRARSLAARFSSVARAGDAAAVAHEADVVVNATAVGLHDDLLPFDPEALRPGAPVLDLVYRRGGDTPLVAAAKRTGHPALDGRTMLVEQGALAFERWFGVRPDRDAMWRALTPG